MSDFLRGGEGEVDTEPVGLMLCRRPLFAEPEVEHVESAGPKAYGADASVLLRCDDPGILEDAQVLHERRQRHRERFRKLGYDRRGDRQPFHDSATRGIREGAEYGVELVVILRHVPKYCTCLRVAPYRPSGGSGRSIWRDSRSRC